MVRNALEMGLISECNGFTTLRQEVTHGDSRIDFELDFSPAPEESFVNNSTPVVINPFQQFECDEPASLSGPALKRKRDRDGPGSTCSYSESGATAISGGHGKATAKKTKKGIVRNCPDIHHRMLLEVKSVTLAPLPNPASGRSGDGSKETFVAEFPDSVSVRATKHAASLTQHCLAGGRAAILLLIQRDDVHAFSPSALDPVYQRALHDAAAAGVLVLAYMCRLCPDSKQVKFLGKVPYIDPIQ
jgi:DNA-binding sugar fermentation-stimulating protein